MGESLRSRQNNIDITGDGFLNRGMKSALIISLIASSVFAQDFDVIIRNGDVYDGSGGEAQHVDVAIKGDRIAGLGDFSKSEREDNRERDRARSRAGIHQYALLVD